MNVLSLFAGIGGLELGLERAGMTVVGQVEINEWCRRVLAKHWPDVPRYEDVRTAAEWWLSEERPPVDVISGGFPCQPVSLAGRRRGQDDERWLWPAMADTIRVLRPRYAVMENVPGLLVRGMGDVLGDLAAIGYDAEWRIVSAASIGAPHLRRRVFIVAYPNSDTVWDQPVVKRRRDDPTVFGSDGPSQPVADAARVGGPHEPRRDSQQQIIAVDRAGDRAARGNSAPRTGELGRGTQFMAGDVADADGVESGSLESAVVGSGRTALGGRAPESGRRSRDVADAMREGSPVAESKRWPSQPASEPGWWATEPDVGRVAHGVPGRVDRLRGLGNAVVPQVAEYVGRLILAHAEAVTA